MTKYTPQLNVVSSSLLRPCLKSLAQEKKDTKGPQVPYALSKFRHFDRNLMVSELSHYVALHI